MALYFPFCIFVATLASVLCGQTTAIRIEITPGVFDKVKNDAVEISCLQKNQVTIQEILVLEIVKDGKPIVVMRHDSKISFIGGNDTRLKVVGHIDKDVSQSYLNLTIMTPHNKDSGQYTCVIDYLDEVGIIKTERENKNLSEQKLDIQSIEDSLAYLKQKIQATEKSCKDQIDHLNTTNVKLTDRVTTLERTSSGQTLDIKGLTEKVDYTTAFSVTHNKQFLTTQEGQVLILSDVIFMIGNVYDTRTGIFTAPRKGLYVFHLVVLAWTTKCRIRMEINAKGKIAARLFAYDSGPGDQSSISPVVDLTVGDKVFIKMLDGDAVCITICIQCSVDILSRLLKLQSSSDKASQSFGRLS